MRVTNTINGLEINVLYLANEYPVTEAIAIVNNVLITLILPVSHAVFLKSIKSNATLKFASVKFWGIQIIVGFKTSSADLRERESIISIGLSNMYDIPKKNKNLETLTSVLIPVFFNWLLLNE